jgi:hypothetical protein
MWLVALVFSSTLIANAKPTCELNYLVKDCLAETTSSLPIKTYTDGSMVANPVAIRSSVNSGPEYENYIARLTNPVPSKIVRAHDLFGQAKKMMIERILGGRTHEALTGGELEMYTRLQLLGDLQIVTNESSICKNPRGVQGAGYSALHQISICPATVNLPETFLFDILAHEISHSIQPCILAQRMLQINEGVDLIKAVTACKSAAKNSEDLQNLVAELKPSLILLENPRIPYKLQALIECGIATIKSSAIPVESYPYGKLRDCINSSVKGDMKKKMDGFIESTEAARKKDREQYPEQKQPNFKRFKKEVKAMYKDLNQNVDCETSASEYFPDFIAADLTSQYLRENKKQRDDPLALTYSYAVQSCYEKESTVGLVNSIHPRGEMRLGVLIKNPTIADFLGCKPPSTLKCSEYDFGPPRRSGRVRSNGSR